MTGINNNETLRFVDSIFSIDPINNLTEKYLYNELAIFLSINPSMVTILIGLVLCKQIFLICFLFG